MPKDCSCDATSARLTKLSTAPRSAWAEVEITWSVPIIPAWANWYGVQAISTIRRRQTNAFMCTPRGCGNLALRRDPPDDGDDDDEHDPAGAARARRHRVDAAGQIAHFLVGHRGHAVLRRGGIEPEGLQLIGHVSTAEEIQHGGAVGLRAVRHDLVGPDHSRLRVLKRRPGHQHDQ